MSQLAKLFIISDVWTLAFIIVAVLAFTAIFKMAVKSYVKDLSAGWIRFVAMVIALAIGGWYAYLYSPRPITVMLWTQIAVFGAIMGALSIGLYEFVDRFFEKTAKVIGDALMALLDGKPGGE